MALRVADIFFIRGVAARKQYIQYSFLTAPCG
jgi:hypothetical protein